MRVFIALALEESLKEALAKVQAELKSLGEDIKWISPQNLHLTLKFLGEVPQEKIPKIIQSLKEISGNFEAFTIEIKNIGGFPNLKSPRVLWAGIEKGKEALKIVTNVIEDALVKLKFPKESRSFSAHLSLGRVTYIKNKEAFCQKISTIQLPALCQGITSLTLFKSTLTPKGPLYEKIAPPFLFKNIA